MSKLKFLIILPFFIFYFSFPAIILAQTTNATLSLSPSSGTYNKGCSFAVDIRLDTNAQSDGADAIILYDQSRFSAGAIVSGSIFPDFPGNSIDEQNGRITVSGLASVNQSFTGQGTLATLNFTVKDNAPTGATSMRFDFDSNDKAKTTDSNVVQKGTVVDILSSVVNGNYTIGTGSCTGASPSPSAGTGPGGVGGPGGTGGSGGTGGGTPSGQIPYKTLPPAGSEQLTFTLAIVGSVLTVLGILGIALL